MADDDHDAVTSCDLEAPHRALKERHATDLRQRLQRGFGGHAAEARTETRGEDDARRQLETLQKLTDGKIAEIDKLTAAKEREVLEG
jgi:ribosome recycling factor